MYFVKGLDSAEFCDMSYFAKSETMRAFQVFRVAFAAFVHLLLVAFVQFVAVWPSVCALFFS